MSEPFRVAPVPAAETRPLRQRVLRPHQRPEDLVLAGDDDPDSGHFAAQDVDGEVIGTASVRREPPPWAPGWAAGEPAWRLRGMATAPEARGIGIGARLLDRVIDHVAA